MLFTIQISRTKTFNRLCLSLFAIILCFNCSNIANNNLIRVNVHNVCILLLCMSSNWQLFKINNCSYCLQSMEWLNEDNLKSVVTIDPQSDCQGFLSTLVHHCGKSWKKYYCVLKGARLYFFVDSVTRFANGSYYSFIYLFV